MAGHPPGSSLPEGNRRLLAIINTKPGRTKKNQGSEEERARAEDSGRLASLTGLNGPGMNFFEEIIIFLANLQKECTLVRHHREVRPQGIAFSAFVFGCRFPI